MTLFSGQIRVFQQESVPTQKAMTKQEWLQRDLLAFVRVKIWFLGSADLKTLDNKLWTVLEDMVCQKLHSLENLRRSLLKAAAEIPLETEHVATAKWPKHLKACVEA
jgi:hypothetical protein